MTLSIDYLNARRAAKPASGGKRYVVTRNAADDRAQWNDLEPMEQALIACERALAEAMSHWRNAPSIDEIVAEIEARESGEIGADDYVPFF